MPLPVGHHLIPRYNRSTTVRAAKVMRTQGFTFWLEASADPLAPQLKMDIPPASLAHTPYPMVGWWLLIEGDGFRFVPPAEVEGAHLERVDP